MIILIMMNKNDIIGIHREIGDWRLGDLLSTLFFPALHFLRVLPPNQPGSLPRFLLRPFAWCRSPPVVISQKRSSREKKVWILHYTVLYCTSLKEETNLNL
jgi:hypothetical protein